MPRIVQLCLHVHFPFKKKKKSRTLMKVSGKNVLIWLHLVSALFSILASFRSRYLTKVILTNYRSWTLIKVKWLISTQFIENTMDFLPFPIHIFLSSHCHHTWMWNTCGNWFFFNSQGRIAEFSFVWN